MKKSLLITVLLLTLIILGLTGLYFINKSPKVSPPINLTATPIESPLVNEQVSLSPAPFNTPVADFKSRITKKPFGILISPKNSPVQPERFSGYHTAVDVEFEDVSDDVAVYAIADSQVALSQTASGYGGVFMITFDLNGARHSALYGHIRPSSIPKVGTSYKKGDRIALLGTGYSSETDGERRHLHFAILSDDSLTIKGYVSTKSQLSGWIDPLSLYP